MQGNLSERCNRNDLDLDYDSGNWMEQQARRVIEKEISSVSAHLSSDQSLHSTQTLCEGSKELRRLEQPIDSRQLSETDLTVLLQLIGQAKVCTDICLLMHKLHKEMLPLNNDGSLSLGTNGTNVDVSFTLSWPTTYAKTLAN